MSTIYVTEDSLHRAAKLNDTTGGLVSVDLLQGSLVAVVHAPAAETGQSLLLSASVGGGGCLPIELKCTGGTPSFFRLSSRSRDNKVAAILLDNNKIPVKMIKVTRFGNGFSVHMIDM